MLLLFLAIERQRIFKKIVNLNFKFVYPSTIENSQRRRMYVKGKKGIADLIRYCKYSSILKEDLLSRSVCLLECGELRYLKDLK